MIANPTVLAFGFSNLAMLGWLAAAAAPLLIHLWSRRRYREVPWAAVEFLLAAMRKNARRLQLQQWLLLALRTLVIVLVVLAVAEPYGDTLLAGRSSTTPTHNVIVLDASYSMAYRDGDESLFARAKQLAIELVRDSGPGDVFTLIVMSHPAQKILGPEVVDRSAVIEEIETLEPSHARADLASTLAVVEESIRDTKNQRHPIDRRAAYFFTDLQRATWQMPRSHAERGNEGKGRGTLERIAALAQKAALIVVDLAPPHRNNLAVTAVSSPQPFITIGQETAFEATLHESGEAPRNELTVELIVDDVPLAEQTVDVPAGGEATVRFTHRFRSAGDHTVAIRAARDPMEIDNSRWLAVPVREEVRVLCVAGKPGAARYIAEALDPDPLHNSPIQPTIVSESELAELELADFDCLFLANVAQLTPNEAERLTRYVQQGGGVVFFLGDRVLADEYNALVAPASRTGQGLDSNVDRQGSVPLGSRHLLPAHLGEVVTEPQFGLDPLDYRHPIVAPFRGRERAGLLTTPVTTYYRLHMPPDADNATVALATKSGDPMVVTAQIGNGRIVLVATDGSLSSIDPATGEPWTAWPTWPSFLPVVREMLNYAVGGNDAERQQRVGTALSGSLRTRPVNDIVRITRPDKGTDSIRATSSPTGAEWHYDRTNLSGIYVANATGSADALAPQQRFAVNLDTAESDLAKADPAELPPELVVRDTWQDAARGTPSGLASRAALHGTFLWAAFLLLLLEAVAAWFFGRGVA